MSECLFCRIVRKEIPASVIFEDEDVLVFNDINPQAPLHALVIPKRHIATLNELSSQDDALAGQMIRRAASIANEQGYADRGFRIVSNTNAEARQTAFHIHLHVLTVPSLT